jgi:transposase-like protein
MAQTRYKREYCGKVVEYFSRFLEMRDSPVEDDLTERFGMVPVVIENGKASVQERPCSGYPSMVKFAKKLGVTPRTLRNWRDKYPEFDEACEFADEIQDEVLNERALFEQVDGRVAMKIRELKANAQKNGDSKGSSGSKLVINLNDDKGAEKIEIKKWVGEINEDTEY